MNEKELLEKIEEIIKDFLSELALRWRLKNIFKPG